MKLLLCLKCQDVIKLDVLGDHRRCKCGSSYGRYVDDINAEYGGPHAMLIGFANSSLVEAIRDQKQRGDRMDGMGRRFEAFIIPDGASSVKKLE